MQDILMFSLIIGMIVIGIFSYPISKRLHKVKPVLTFLSPLVLWIFVGVLLFFYFQITDLLALGLLLFAIIFAIGAIVSTIMSILVILKNKKSA
ncbi:MAG TPA: hypothetical protein VK005_02345 [Acholeplasma sp.]|nr:hypothetical protein [Acholeplasma sp.]